MDGSARYSSVRSSFTPRRNAVRFADPFVLGSSAESDGITATGQLPAGKKVAITYVISTSRRHGALMSATQSRSSSRMRKCRSTKSGGRITCFPGVVVRTKRRREMPRNPANLISRATRLQPM